MRNHLPTAFSFAHRGFVVAYVLLLLLLIATSTPRRVGDGNEYAAIAASVAHGRIQDLSDHPHFWFYPALAAPGVRAGLEPFVSFTATNVLLLVVAFWVVSRARGPALAFLLFAGPIIWWVDKPHTEVFTFSLLAIAFARYPGAPGLSLLCIGVAATQNPPIALLIPISGGVALWAWPALRRDRAFWSGTVAGIAMALLHPAFYLLQTGRPTNLLAAFSPMVPPFQRLMSVVWDPNLGLVFAFPGLALIAIVGTLWLVRTCPAKLFTPEMFVAVMAALVFLLSFAQTTNINSGATPGMSRYGLWLVPLSIPLLAVLGASLQRKARRATAVVVAASCAWSLVGFHPRRAESYLQPSLLSGYLWTHHPGLTDPLPEVFIERLIGREEWVLPIATPRCEKALLVFSSDHAAWPQQCQPARLPERCRTEGALCYANRADTGYAFAPVWRPPYFFPRIDQSTALGRTRPVARASE